MRETRWCGGCAAEVEFERFDCADHGADCVELVCVSCGLGVETETIRAPHVPVVARHVSAA